MYFTSRRLYPNVDFYSGVVYRQLGFSSSSFCLLFAAARMAGWTSHLKEYFEFEIKNEENKLLRPQQIFTGAGEKTLSCLDTRTQVKPNLFVLLFLSYFYFYFCFFIFIVLIFIFIFVVLFLGSWFCLFVCFLFCFHFVSSGVEFKICILRIFSAVVFYLLIYFIISF